MADFLDIASTLDIPLGRVKAFQAGESKVAVAHTNEGFFDLDNSCPHRGGPLGEGDVIANEVVCPWHLWGFDMKSGLCAGNPDIHVATHELKIEGNRILVRPT